MNKIATLLVLGSALDVACVLAACSQSGEPPTISESRFREQREAWMEGHKDQVGAYCLSVRNHRGEITSWTCHPGKDRAEVLLEQLGPGCKAERNQVGKIKIIRCSGPDLTV